MPGIKFQKIVDLEWTLREVFGKQNFRPVQREAIQAALDGHDVFVQAATSFGKSLCFQLPAVVDIGVTIVVSPLLALMNNQINALREAHIPVATINGSIPPSEREPILADLKCGHPRTKLLYVTPEYCVYESFRRVLRTMHSQGQLCRIAIDEAHCISEWGHDFRTSFQDLKFFKREFPQVPMICLTATAPSRVRQDVISTLMLDPAKLRMFAMPTSRPNLHYEVRFKSDQEDQYDDFISWIRAVHARRLNSHRAAELKSAGQRSDNVSGIIYTLYRKDCEALAARLAMDGIGAKPFHAGLPNDVKDKHLQGWIDNTPGYDIIVATTAFGMGIDKNNCRFVVHWQIPKSFEGFYQEAGRAGRDGKASACIMYYGREDRDRATTMLQRELSKKGTGRGRNHGQYEDVYDAEEAIDPRIKSRVKSFQALVSFCEATNTCRHKAIARYFGDSSDPPCDLACDWHKDAEGLVRRKDRGLASEEWCSTQREMGTYAMDEYE